MKKNLLGGIVMFFVTLAFLLVIDDISKSKIPSSQENVQIKNSIEKQDMVINDDE